jgi:hypothetical protein
MIGLLRAIRADSLWRPCGTRFERRDEEVLRRTESTNLDARRHHDEIYVQSVMAVVAILL